MGTPPRDAASLRRLILQNSKSVEKRDLRDVSRLSMEARVTRTTPGRSLTSTGLLHLTGEAAKGHSADFGSVGELMTTWQKLVTAIGASHRDARSIRGRLPAEITNLTRLTLRTSPLPGSVVLRFAAATPPEAELVDEGGLRLFDQPETQLVDISVREAVGLLSTAREMGPDADGSELIEELKELGPRVASSLVAFASHVEGAGIEMDVEWRQPGRQTDRASFTPSIAGHVVSVVRARELDSERVVLRGDLVTASSEQSLAIRDDQTHELVSIKRGNLSLDEIRQVVVTDRVAVTVDAVRRSHPGNDTRTEYTAVHIERID